jgi:hypothetical protein
MTKTPELELTGKGVAPIHIKELDQLVDAYITERDERIILTRREVEAKRGVLEAMHRHAEQLRTAEGTLAYRYDETLVLVIPGKEKLKVKTDGDDDEEESDD